MPLRYGLIENHLTTEPGDYMAVVQDNETFSEEQIVERMINRGSTVTKAEALGVLEEYGLALEDLIKGGYNINTKLFCVYPSISGVFNGSDDSFDSRRHSIRLNVSVGNRFAKSTDSISTQKVGMTSPAPVLEKFTNLKTKAVNETFTTGQVASITGLLLKFNEEDASQGIFFIAADGTETRVTNISKNKPSELIFFVPDDLTSGSFQVEVRTILQNHKNLSKGKLLNSLVPVS
jgi:hypothetical protein